MLKIKLKLGLILIITVLQCFSQAAIIPNSNLSYHNNQSGWLEFKPNNGLLLLRGVKENSSNFLHEAMIFKTILNAIRLMPLQNRNTLNDLNQKMYGDGVEHKFPPFMERVIQRIQTYFSIYKYTDAATSSSNQQTTPLTVDNGNKTTTTNGSLNFDDYNEIDVNLTSTNLVNNNNKNKTRTTIKPLAMKPTKTSTRKTTLPTAATTTTTAATTIIDDNVENSTADEENEFIEIKKNL